MKPWPLSLLNQIRFPRRRVSFDAGTTLIEKRAPPPPLRERAEKAPTAHPELARFLNQTVARASAGEAGGSGAARTPTRDTRPVRAYAPRGGGPLFEAPGAHPRARVRVEPCDADAAHRRGGDADLLQRGGRADRRSDARRGGRDAVRRMDG